MKVHPEFLASQSIPQELIRGDIWKNRYQDIRSYERYLSPEWNRDS